MGLNRVECVHETLRAALNRLAVVVPDWLQSWVPVQWYKEYGKRLDEFRMPKEPAQREALALLIGQDGFRVLQAIYQTQELEWLAKIPAIEILRQVWLQHYQFIEGEARWRANDNTPPSSLFIDSPYDVEAHYAKKRSTSWVGYKVHLSESCEEDAPHLITNVETSSASTADDALTPTIHASVQKKALLPKDHLVDTGYLDAELLVESKREYQVNLIGPTRADYKWQAKAGLGFEAASFAIDWQAKQARWPQDKLSKSWSPAIDRRHNEVIKIKFSPKDCQGCVSRELCTKSVRARRTITIRPKEQYLTLEARRAEEGEEEFKKKYALRAGVEGTLSQGVRAFGLRRSRYIGQAKTHLQHHMTGAALNLVRVIAWLDGTALSKTRTSHLAALAPAA